MRPLRYVSQFGCLYVHVHGTRSLAVGILTRKMGSWSDLSSDKSGKHLVHITHFFNPHHFWFKFIDAEWAQLDELNELEANIYEYTKKRQHDKTFSWQIGDIIAAYSFTWNKWVRGRVENVFEVKNGTPRYSLWAIDCGIPMNVIGKNTFPLPKELAESSVCAVHEGCVYGIMPAEQVCLALSIRFFSNPKLIAFLDI